MKVAWSCPTLRPHGLLPTRLLRPWNFPGKNTGVGHHFLLQGIFPTQGSNTGLLHCSWILYHLSHQESPSLGIHHLIKSVSVQFSSVQLLSHVRLFATQWTTACQPSLSFTISESLLKLMTLELVLPSNHLILCRPLLLPPSIFPSIRVFSNESGSQSIRVSA